MKHTLITEIRPYPQNAKKHPKKQVEQIAASIQQFGFNQPIVVDADGVIIVGHGRYHAAQKLGLKEVPVQVVNLAPELANAYRLADNKLNESEWDMKLVVTELLNLSPELIDLTGFSRDLVAMPDEADDAIPQVSDTPVAQLGDVYQLGEHRVMCGDSLSVEAVSKLMNGERADMMFTDPPYNVAFNGRSGKFDVIKNDDLSDSAFQDFIDGFLSILAILKPQTYYICCNWAFYGVLQLKLKPSACIVWAKNVFGMGKGYRHQHEFILFDGFVHANIKNESDLWEIKKDTNYQHPTQKPVDISLRAIKNSSKEGNVVVDLFLGSGSTLIAAEKIGRRCYGMELDPHYVDIIIARWEEYTGQKASKIEA